MFEEFYGFKNTPFSKTVPSTSLYTGNDTNEIVDRLKYAAKKQLFAVLTGDSGTGNVKQVIMQSKKQAAL